MTQYTYDNIHMNAMIFLKVKEFNLSKLCKKNGTCPILELPENIINHNINKNLFLWIPSLSFL